MRAGKAFGPNTFVRVAGTLTALLALLLVLRPAQAAAQAAPDTSQRVPGKPGPVLPADGSYLVGDTARFSIDRYGEYERLHFTDSDEIFYLTIEPAPLGGRVLKYDTGEVALQVAGWGGVTLYTREAPGGVPAERTGDPQGLNESAPAADQVISFATHVSDEMKIETGLTIGFKANWAALSAPDVTRWLACNSILNSARAIERIASARKMKDALIAHFSIVRIAPAAAPGVSLGDKLLTVNFAPPRGLPGRPSSLAIAKAIREALR